VPAVFLCASHPAANSARKRTVATALEIREKRNKLTGEMRELADKAHDKPDEWTDEDEARWTAINEDYNRLSRQIEMAERAEAVEAEGRQVVDDLDAIDDAETRDAARRALENAAGGDGDQAVTDEHRAMAMQAWCLTQLGCETTDAQRDAARRCGVNPNRKTLDVGLETRYDRVRRLVRAMSVGTDAAGGYTSPTGFVPNLEQALLDFGGVRQVATVLRTATGNDLEWPTVDDTGNSGALIAENVEDSEQDVAVGQKTLNAYKYTSKLVRVSAELLQDSAFNMAMILGSLLGERLARIYNTHQTTGTGSSQPNGIVTSSTAGKTAAAVAAITADELIDLFHSVDPAYRNDAGFMFHDSVALALRKLKDGDNQYIWQPGLQSGQPDRLLDKPVQINQDMAGTIEASAKTVLFGAFKKYVIREVAVVRLKRLVERYAEYDQEGFVALGRMDGELIDAGTNPVKHLIQAAS